MKLYTHWVFRAEDDHLTKHFFATKGEEETAAKDQKKKGHRVVARHDWKVEPTAKDVARFCNEQLHLREYDERQADLGDMF